MLTLILKEGNQPQTLQLSQDVITFGRSKENVVVIRNIKASRHHAKIERVGGTYQITDLGSGNGTKVNGEKIDFHTLETGDEIKIGDATLTLKSIDDAVESADSAGGEINLDESDDIKVQGEEAPAGEEIELEVEGEKIEIQDDEDDVPLDEKETEISIKPAPAPAKPGPRPLPGKPAPAKPAEGEKKPGLKRPLFGDRLKKKP